MLRGPRIKKSRPKTSGNEKAKRSIILTQRNIAGDSQQKNPPLGKDKWHPLFVIKSSHRQALKLSNKLIQLLELFYLSEAKKSSDLKGALA